jgi:hypothetical protein
MEPASAIAREPLPDEEPLCTMQAGSIAAASTSPKPTGPFMLRYPLASPTAETYEKSVYGCDVGLSLADAASSFCAACFASSGPPSTASADSYSAFASEAWPS